MNPSLKTSAAVSFPNVPESLPADDWSSPATEEASESPCPAQIYSDYQRVLGGRGTTCVPLAATAGIPAPDEVRDLWNQAVQQSNQQTLKQITSQQTQTDQQKSKKLERLLEIAISSGNMDLAMLAFSALSTDSANDVSKGLLTKMSDLEAQKSDYAQQISGLNSNSPDDAKKVNDLNLKIGDIGTQMSMLQTFLQDATSQKNQAEEMASSYLKGQNDLGMSIARNIG